MLDTTVLSLAFRRSNALAPEAMKLRRLIEDDVQLSVPGMVLQELLSGIREPVRFVKMQEVLSGFPLLFASREDRVDAARLANTCRKAGIATTAPDCLIAAQAIRCNAQLFTTDQDFEHMARVSALALFHIDHG